MNKKKIDEMKYLYNKGREILTGGDEQADTEINQVCNKTLCDKYERMVQQKGFTMLIAVIRTAYKKSGNMNHLDFAYNLTTLLDQEMNSRYPEIDGGKEARAFLKKQFGYTDL